jgi:two-component system sensor histidine kinase KdpD
VIAGASSSLAEEGDKFNLEESKALAQSIYDQARDMSELVTKVLQMTRLDEGFIELQRDWTSVAEITGSVLARLEELLAGHLLVVDIPPDLPLVRADAVLVEQALANLVENAARHTPPGTVVWVSAERRGNELVISVEDRGPGIKETDLEQVFAKFHRGAGEHSSTGVGLGLAICRAIVGLHGGRVWVDQPSSGGAAFRFTLPVEDEPAAPSESG